MYALDGAITTTIESIDAVKVALKDFYKEKVIHCNIQSRIIREGTSWSIFYGRCMCVGRSKIVYIKMI